MKNKNRLRELFSRGIEEEILEELKWISFETDEDYEYAKENFEFDVIYDVQELNERYNLNLNDISEYEYDDRHFDFGSWFISKSGFFVRYWTD